MVTWWIVAFSHSDGVCVDVVSGVARLRLYSENRFSVDDITYI